MNHYTLAGGIVAMLMYAPLCRKILSGKVKQRFSTWILWFILDVIAAATIYLRHGAFLLPAIYAIGSLVVSLSILKSKNFGWTNGETATALATGVCIMVWLKSGTQNAIIASTLATVIATVPLIISCIEIPWENPLSEYLGFFIAAGLSTIGAKSWTIEERLYPATCTALSVLIVGLISRKFFYTSRDFLEKE